MLPEYVRKMDVDDAHPLVRTFTRERFNEEIFQLRIHGLDPMKIPVYEKYILEQRGEPKRVNLSEEEAEEYKGIIAAIFKDREKNKDGIRIG